MYQRIYIKSGYSKYLILALRILLDFDDLENSISVNPTGQSGHILSRHYDDQAALFNRGRFRKQMMNQEEIQATCKNVLRLVPGE